MNRLADIATGLLYDSGEVIQCNALSGRNLR